MIVWMDEGLQEPDRPLALGRQTIFKRTGVDRPLIACKSYIQKDIDRWSLTRSREGADDHIRPEAVRPMGLEQHQSPAVFENARS